MALRAKHGAAMNSDAPSICVSHSWLSRASGQEGSPETVPMPYLRSNWEGLAATRFAAGLVHSFDNITLKSPEAVSGASRPRRGLCFVHVTLEQDSRVTYLEMIASAKSVDMYMLGGGSATGDYAHVCKMDGRRATDHPYKYHYRFEKEDLPKDRLALLQLRLSPHYETSQEIVVYKFSVLVGDVGKSGALPPSFMPDGRTTLRPHRGVPLLASGDSTTMRANGAGAGAIEEAQGPVGGGAMTWRGRSDMRALSTSSGNSMTPAGGGQLIRGGEGAVVADALNDVMGRMLTVVTRKTQGYVDSTYRKTEDKLQQRMRNMEERISGFEVMVTEDLGRRILDLEHVMETLQGAVSEKAGAMSEASSNGDATASSTDSGGPELS